MISLELGERLGSAFQIFLFLLLITLFPIIRPDLAAKWSIVWTKWYLKFMGYEVDIKATPQTYDRFRFWNLVILIFGTLLSTFMILVFK